MQVQFNGKLCCLTCAMSVADFMAQMAIEPEGVAIAINSYVIAKAAWPTTVIAAGDQIELVYAVHGG